jgi:hypothetical protein
MKNIYRIILILTFLFLYSATVNDYAGNFYKNNRDRVELSIMADMKNCNSFFDKSVITSYLKEWQEYRLNKNVYKLIPAKYQRYVLQFCISHDLPVKLAYACYHWESGWNNRSLGYNHGSHTWDIGICQINSYWQWAHASAFFKSQPLVKFNVYNEFHNLEVGLGLLNSLYKDFGYNIDKALIAYNAGYWAAANNRVPASTKIYVKRIKSIMYSV